MHVCVTPSHTRALGMHHGVLHLIVTGFGLDVYIAHMQPDVRCAYHHAMHASIAMLASYVLCTYICMADRIDATTLYILLYIQRENVL